jgi:hypothetical protein
MMAGAILFGVALIVFIVRIAKEFTFDTKFSIFGVLGTGALGIWVIIFGRQLKKSGAALKDWLTMFGLIGVCLATAAISSMIVSSIGPSMDGFDGLEFLGCWVITSLLCVGAIVAIVTFNSCPSCGKRSAKVVLGSEEVDRAEGYQTVMRHDQIRGKDGGLEGWIHRDEQIRVTQQRIRTYCQCKFCRHEWFVDQIRTSS